MISNHLKFQWCKTTADSESGIWKGHNSYSSSVLITSAALVENTLELGGDCLIQSLESSSSIFTHVPGTWARMTQRLGSAGTMNCTYLWAFHVAWASPSMAAQFCEIVSQVGASGERVFTPVFRRIFGVTFFVLCGKSGSLRNAQIQGERNQILPLDGGKQGHKAEEHMEWEILLCQSLENTVYYNPQLYIFPILSY